MAGAAHDPRPRPAVHGGTEPGVDRPRHDGAHADLGTRASGVQHAHARRGRTAARPGSDGARSGRHPRPDAAVGRHQCAHLGGPAGLVWRRHQRCVHRAFPGRPGQGRQAGPLGQLHRTHGGIGAQERPLRRARAPGHEEDRRSAGPLARGGGAGLRAARAGAHPATAGQLAGPAATPEPPDLAAPGQAGLAGRHRAHEAAHSTPGQGCAVVQARRRKTCRVAGPTGRQGHAGDGVGTDRLRQGLRDRGGRVEAGAWARQGRGRSDLARIRPPGLGNGVAQVHADPERPRHGLRAI